MIKRIMPVSLYPVCLIVAIIAIVLPTFEVAGAATTDIEQAQGYFENSDYQQAEQIYQGIIKQCSDADQALEAQKGLVMVYISWGKQADAEMAYQQLLLNFPHNTHMADVIHHGIASHYRKCKKNDKADEIDKYVLSHWPTTESAMWAQVDIVGASINSGDYTAAQTGIDNLFAGFANNEHLCDAIHSVAYRYRQSAKTAKADELDQYVLNHRPSTESAMWAQVDVINSNIDGKDYTTAQTGIDNLLARFSSNENMANVLHGMAYKYRQAQKTAKADELDKYVLNHWPSSEIALWARVDIIKSDADANEQGLTTALSNADNLLTNFADEEQLVFGVLAFQIVDGYRELEQDEKAYQFYKKLISNWPGRKYTLWSQTVAALANIKLGDIAAAEAAIDKLRTDFSTHPKFSDVTLIIAEKYEEQPNKGEQAKQMYQRIVKEYPSAVEANNSVIDIRRLDIWEILRAGDINTSYAMVDKFIADFNTHPHLPAVMLQLGKEYYARAHRYEQEDRYEQAKEYFKKAVAVWDKIITQLPSSAAYTPEACYFVAYCAFENTGDYEKAIECCQRVVINWPDYKYACDIQFLLGNYHERLAHSGLIPEPEANTIIEQAYEAVVEKYPNCDKVKNASVKLAEMNFKKGQWDKAATYYEILLATFPENEKPASVLYLLGQTYDNMGKVSEAVRVYNEFLIKAQIGDPRIENAKRRVQQLMGSANAKSVLSDGALSSIYGGCLFCGSQPWCPGACIAPANGGICSGGDIPVCNWVGECYCDTSCKMCRDNPPIEPCKNTTTSCPSSSCSASFCYPYGNECKTSTTTGWCSGSIPWCTN